MEVVLAIVLSCFAVASSTTCDMAAPLPRSSSMNDLKKIAGIWYRTVSSNDYISAQNICGTLSQVHVNSDLDGFTGLITDYYNDADPRSFHIYQSVTADGNIGRDKIDNRELEVHLLDEYGKTNAKTLEEVKYTTFNSKEFSLITDGSRYVGYVNCTPEGWAVWIHTPQKVLTTEELLYIRNELEKRGIHSELKLSKCENISPE